MQGLKRQTVILAKIISVVPVHQQFVPQHQRVAAALAQEAALQRRMLVGCEPVDVGFEIFVDGDLLGGL